MPLQIGDQVGIDHREFARQVRFDEQVLVGGLDGLRHAANIRNRRGGGNGHRIAVAHADLPDPFAKAIPIQGQGTILLQITAPLLFEQRHGINRQDALAPQ